MDDIELQKIVAEMRQQGILSERFSGQGDAGFGGGILSGGGGLQYRIPIDRLRALMLRVGGGGAYGSVPTPDGKQRVREFAPNLGFGYERQF